MPNKSSIRLDSTSRAIKAAAARTSDFRKSPITHGQRRVIIQA